MTNEDEIAEIIDILDQAYSDALHAEIERQLQHILGRDDDPEITVSEAT